MIKMPKISKNGKRFFTQHDMAIIKLDDSIVNSKIKRGEVKPREDVGVDGIYPCGCGATGYFIHTRGTKKKEESKQKLIDKIKILPGGMVENYRN
jgi:hypothetical protein